LALSIEEALEKHQHTALAGLLRQGNNMVTQVLIHSGLIKPPEPKQVSKTDAPAVGDSQTQDS